MLVIDDIIYEVITLYITLATVSFLKSNHSILSATDFQTHYYSLQMYLVIIGTCNIDSQRQIRGGKYQLTYKKTGHFCKACCSN